MEGAAPRRRPAPGRARRVLTHRVAHLIRAHGVKPNEILAITFTNKAATEMRERLERILGRTARAIWILTFHAACGRILRREAERLGYRSSFTIYDQADQVRVVKACLEELGKDPKRFTPRGIRAQISNAKNQLISPDEYASRVASFWDQTVAEVYELYQRKLFASNAVDFDDMLMLTVDVLERFPEALERWQSTFRHVLVDEYQDTNHAQYRLLQLLAAKHRNVCAVGDPDQSIYAFKAPTSATSSTSRRTSAGRARSRSSRTTARPTRSSRPRTRSSTTTGIRKPKRLWSELGDGDPVEVVEVEDEHAEARFVAAEIARCVETGYSASEVAVFYRTNAQSRVLEDVLVRQGVAYQVIGGPRFYERAEIKDAVAYLSLLNNPDDAVALMRIANRPRRRRHLDPAARRARGRARHLALGATSDPEAAGVATASARAIRGFRTIVESLMSAAQELEVDELVQAVLDRSGTIEAYEAERTIEARGRIENLSELVGSAQEYRASTTRPSQGSSRRSAAVRPGHAVEGHAAGHAHDDPQREGLEYRVVFLIGMEDGIFPHARSIEDNEVEEERRLAYVGMTRAMERLTLTRDRTLALRAARVQPPIAVPRRAAVLGRARAAAAASWSGYAQSPRQVVARQSGTCPRSRPVTRCGGSLGEGVVTRIEPDGVVTVRFSADGSERRLMLDYAPLEL